MSKISKIMEWNVVIYIYIRPGATKLNAYKENDKFDGTVDAYHIGEYGCLIIGAQQRGCCNSLIVIDTPPFCWLQYKLDEMSQTIDKHFNRPWLMEWKHEMCCVADFFRSITRNSIKMMKQHI